MSTGSEPRPLATPHRQGSLSRSLMHHTFTLCLIQLYLTHSWLLTLLTSPHLISRHSPYFTRRDPLAAPHCQGVTIEASSTGCRPL